MGDGTDARGALQAALKDEPILAAWLFGSAARDDLGPLSDVDIALLPQPGLDAKARLRLLGRVAASAQKAWHVDRADVVFVDEAAPTIAFEAVHGDLLIDHDPGERVVQEARLRSIYHDRQYYMARRRRMNAERWRRGEFA